MRYSNWLRCFLHYYDWTARQLFSSRVHDAVRDAYLRGWSPTTAAQFVDDLLTGDDLRDDLTGDDFRDDLTG